MGGGEGAGGRGGVGWGVRVGRAAVYSVYRVCAKGRAVCMVCVQSGTGLGALCIVSAEK